MEYVLHGVISLLWFQSTVACCFLNRDEFSSAGFLTEHERIPLKFQPDVLLLCKGRCLLAQSRYVGVHDMIRHLEGEDDCMRIVMPLNVYPCVRASAQTNARALPVMSKACRVCVPGAFYVLQALHDLV